MSLKTKRIFLNKLFDNDVNEVKSNWISKYHKDIPKKINENHIHLHSLQTRETLRTSKNLTSTLPTVQRRTKVVTKKKQGKTFMQKEVFNISKAGLTKGTFKEAFNYILSNEDEYKKFSKNYKKANPKPPKEVPKKIHKKKGDKNAILLKLQHYFLKEGLKYDIQNKMNFPFQVIKTERFSEKFRYYEQKVSKFDEINKKVIDKVTSSIHTKKIAFETLEMIQKEKRKTKNAMLLEKLRRVMIRAAIDFKRLNISAKEFYTMYNVTVPFSNEKSKALFLSIKNRNTDDIIKLIKENKYLLLDFDNFHQTPLIWAAKRNCYDVIARMVSNGACVNNSDDTGKTALHYAAINDNLEATMILLYEMASPFQKDKNGLSARDYAQNKLINYIIKRAADIHVVHYFGKHWDFIKNVRKGLLYMYSYEINKPFTNDIFNYETEEDKNEYDIKKDAAGLKNKLKNV